MKFNLIKMTTHKIGKKVNFQNFTRAFIISAAIFGIKHSHAMDEDPEKGALSSLPKVGKIDHALKKELRTMIDTFYEGLRNICMAGTFLQVFDAPQRSGDSESYIGFRKMDVLDSGENLWVDCDVIIGFSNEIGNVKKSAKIKFTFNKSQSYEMGKKEEVWAALKAEVFKSLNDTLRSTPVIKDA